MIEDLIRDEPAPRLLTVVSDDRRLKDAARRRQCPTPTCLDFYEKSGTVQRPPDPEPAPQKPGALSEQEVEEWLKTFGAD